MLRLHVRHLTIFLILVVLAVESSAKSGVEKGDFRFEVGRHGIAAIANPKDPLGAVVTNPKAPLELIVRYKKNGTWTELNSRSQSVARKDVDGSILVKQGGRRDPVVVSQRFKGTGETLDWDIELATNSTESVTVGDLAIHIPEIRPEGEEPKPIFERSFVRHEFISGNGSFLYFVRASGVGPFLVMTVKPGTNLEYFSRNREGTLDYIHSGKSGSEETHGTWRQPHTNLTLKPSGQDGSVIRYGFRFRWADSYDEMREILYEEGLFDTRFVPGMVIPEDLDSHFSLRTKARVESIEAEFPEQTRVISEGTGANGNLLYRVNFRKLGENKLTIHHDSGRTTYLEFFVTEPIETLIKKRSEFIVTKQQVHDPSKWWDGVFAPFDMRTGVLRTPEDPDIFIGRMSYVLTCDDPGLSKAPYIAEKNVSFPNEKEIRGLEYYLEHFVWGKLQRTGEELPYPYGVYGTPDWYTNRDPQRRARITNKNLDKMHVWRSYDYPHMVMLYFHMYEIAKKYPNLSHYLDAKGYLERAWQTAHAFYIYPYEIFPTYYETYKWGLYNELVVLKLANALDQEGFGDHAKWLRAEWEKKVKYFVYDDPYPYRSEYAFDRTAFESSYAFAKYGATHDMKPDQNLWWDVQKKKWYSHPKVERSDSRAFMERQLAAGLVVRGWVEPAYYKLGADHGVSYMAAMGGWGILDYGLNFAEKPYDWLQLGYASYLSSWSLMNTGTAESNYGYWFPGKNKDGAAGWEYTPAKYGYAWMGSNVPRGAWFYDGEIDLGYGAALRMASTIVTRDPIFGWISYGGNLEVKGDALSVVPRDGLRQRFAMIVAAEQGQEKLRKIKIELERDGFTPERPIETDQQLRAIRFQVENRSGDDHVTVLKLAALQGVTVRLDGTEIVTRETGDPDYPVQVDLAIRKGGENRVEIRSK